MNVILRKSGRSDIPFLREMLYEAAYWRVGVEKPSLEAGLARPDIGKILADWGEREGDTAVIASIDSIPVGSAWYRFWSDSNFSFGFVNDRTPELGIGVCSNYRHQGIGREMIAWIIDYASKHAVQQISLSVAKENYAKNLYLQQGFREYADVGLALTMVRKIEDITSRLQQTQKPGG